MHAENVENFHVPPDVIKRHVRPGQFVELRIDSPRFSVHEDDPEKRSCPSCNGEVMKPILRHNHPASLVRMSNRTFRRIRSSLSVDVATRYGCEENPADRIMERLDLARNQGDWQAVAELAAELRG